MILLDTHVLIWYLSDDKKLPPLIRDLIKSDPGVRVSSASIWEMAIKGRAGNLDFNGAALDSPEALQAVVEECEKQGFRFISVTEVHGLVAPFLPGDHKDPFDRILAAQSFAPDSMFIVSADPAFDRFGPQVRRWWPGTPFLPTSPTRKPSRSLR